MKFFLTILFLTLLSAVEGGATSPYNADTVDFHVKRRNLQIPEAMMLGEGRLEGKKSSSLSTSQGEDDDDDDEGGKKGAPFCRNTKPFGLQDSGCNDECKICVMEDRTEPDMDEGGDECVVCIDDNNLLPDSGCERETPVCVTDESGVGDLCAVCIKTDSPVDNGCTPEQPICNGPGVGQPGTACFKCQDTSTEGPDDGCPVGYGVCVAVGPDASGNFGNECAVCINDVFNDDQSGSDTGCEDPEFGVCVGHYWEGGKSCATCVNEVQDPSQPDPGCTDPANPSCNAVPGEPGLECTPECTTGPVNQECTEDTECCPFVVGFDGGTTGTCLPGVGIGGPMFGTTSTCIGKSCGTGGQGGDSGFCVPGLCKEISDSTCTNLCQQVCDCPVGPDPTILTPTCSGSSVGTECDGSCCGCDTLCDDFCLTCQYRKVTGRTMTYEDAVANIPALDCVLTPISSFGELQNVASVRAEGEQCWVGITKEVPGGIDRRSRATGWVGPDGSTVPVPEDLNDLWVERIGQAQVDVQEPNNSNPDPQPYATIGLFNQDKLRDVAPFNSMGSIQTFNCAIYRCGENCPIAPPGEEEICEYRKVDYSEPLSFATAIARQEEGCFLTSIANLAELNAVTALASQECWVGIKTTPSVPASTANWFNVKDDGPAPFVGTPVPNDLNFWKSGEPNNTPASQPYATVGNNANDRKLRDVGTAATFTCGIYKCCS